MINNKLEINIFNEQVVCIGKTNFNKMMFLMISCCIPTNQINRRYHRQKITITKVQELSWTDLAAEKNTFME